MFGEIQFLLFQIVIIGMSVAIGVFGFSLTGVLLRNAPTGPKWIVMTAAFLLSLGTPLYFDFGVIAHAWVQHKTGEDNFLDGTYHYRLPNNYELVIFDEMPEESWLDKTKSQESAIEKVRGLQVSGDWLLVAHYKGRDDFHLIRTSDDTDQSFFTVEELRKAAATQGISLNLLPTREYLRQAEDESHFHGWALALFLLGPIVLWMSLISGTIALRREQSLTAGSHA